MAYHTERTRKAPNFMNIPVELRLRIYGYLTPKEIHVSFAVDSNRLDSNNATYSDLAALARTCERVHCEVDDVIYREKKFDILVADFFSKRNLQVQELDLGFLKRMRRVTVNVYCCHGANCIQLLQVACKILEALASSSTLETFTFAVNHAYSHAMATTLSKLRSMMVEDGVRVHGGPKEMELEYAREEVHCSK